MNPESFDAVGPAFGELVDSSRGVGPVGIKEASSFEEVLRGFIGEAVFKVAVIVLVGLGVDDDGVIDPGLLDEGNVVLECGRFRLVGSLWVERELLCVRGKKVDVRIDEQRFGWNREGQESAAQHIAMICSNHHVVLAYSRLGPRAFVALASEAVWRLPYREAGTGRIVDGLDRVIEKRRQARCCIDSRGERRELATSVCDWREDAPDATWKRA